MSKILILGMSPLPFENDIKVYGTGIRSWQFILPILKKGHKLCVCNYAIPSAYPDNFNSRFNKDFCYISRIDKNNGNSNNSGNLNYSFEYNILKKDDFENTRLIAEIYYRFKPDCIVGCNFYPSFIASNLLAFISNNIDSSIKSRTTKYDSGVNNNGDISNENITKITPFWADLFGHVMAEAQARAASDGDDSCLFHYWNSEYNIISTADIFSCVSSRQKYALIGELGAAGRLNRHTSRYDFAHTIPCGMPEEEYKHTKVVVREKDGISRDDLVVLWTGGYNTWTDVDTLFKGLSLAMEQNEHIKFVSTGGEIPEQDTATYPNFLSMIEKSPYRDRFIMKGWIPGEDVPNYYLESDIGINIDKDIYEVKLGSKNRILDWMRAGLCVLSSNVCELTEIITSKKIGYTFMPGDPYDLSKKLTYLASHRQEVKETALAGKKYGVCNFNFDKTTMALQEWAKNPGFSPDKGKERKIFFSREEAIRNLNQIVLRQKRMIAERDRKISELEGIVKKGLIYRIYNYFKIFKRKISK